MKADQVVQAIPLELANQLCAEIRAEADQNWHTLTARWCWSCQRVSGGDPEKRGFFRAPDNRGCTLINTRYAQLYA